MVRSIGAALGSLASAVLVATLLAAFAVESAGDVLLYYGFRTVNPLLAGVLAVGVIVAFAAAWAGRLSAASGSGIALGLALIILLVVVAWALTGRVDVFLAPGWAFPAQRWILVVVAALIVLGTGLHAWSLGLLSGGRER